MAEMHSLFLGFNGKIKLDAAKETELKGSRNAIRNAAKSWMSENGHGAISFCMQGSVAMHTAINPVLDGDYDVDDGLYLNAYKDKPDCDWPSCSTVHEWVRRSVENETTSDPIDKNTCVRVVYKHGYHVDIPIYILNNGKAFLAHKRDGWINSDAKEFSDWFADRCRPNNGQLRHVVRYLKRWKDENEVNLKGITLTILAADNFVAAPGRDDDALRYTVESIAASLESSFTCNKPVAPYENLLEGFSESGKAAVLAALSRLLQTLEDAHDEVDEGAAVEKLQLVFGEDFPHASSSTNGSTRARTTAPAVLIRDGRSG